MRQKDTLAPSISNELLTELALDAAIVLDKRLHNQMPDQAAVTAFLDTIEKIVDFGREQTSGMLVPDPRKVGVLNRAFRYLNQEKVSTIQDLLAKLKVLSEGYRKSASEEEIRRLRDFCVALHKELVANAYKAYEEIKRGPQTGQNASKLF